MAEMVALAIVIAVVLGAAGALLAVTATRERRQRWRDAQPFAGGERAAPEPVLVPPRTVLAVYLGWFLVGVAVVVVILALV
ncbi:MAG: hypothetical protein ACLFXM_07765 [Acidimicrobiia bacterium]